MRQQLPRAVSFLALAAALGCNQARQSPLPVPASAERGQASLAPAHRLAAVAPAPKTSEQPAARPALAAQTAARKLIRTGQVAIEVRDYDDAVKQAQALVERLGGYLADTQTNRGVRDRRYGSLTARVPAAQFGAALAEIKALGKVTSENVTAQDVTKAYTDIETRLRIKRETAARLQEILRGRTAKLSDVLEVERELARVTEEIETIEGERRFYDQQIALSAITVNLSEPDAVVSAGAFDPIVTALRSSVQVLSVSVAAIIAVVVFTTPWALLLWLVWRIVARLRARHRARTAPPAA